MRRLAILLTILALAACKAAPPEGVTVLTYASPYPPSHPFSRADITWMKFVEGKAGGRLKIKPYWSGGLLSSSQSLIEIRHGVSDIGLVIPIYARGGTHLVRAQSGFYGGVANMQDQVTIYKCLAAEFPQLNREMEGLQILAVQGGNFPGVVTRDRPIRTLADFKGMRLRVPSELTAVMRELGADPVDMPMGEVYSAMAKGVIDGVVAPTDTFKSLHFGEIAKYYSNLHVSRGGYPARAMSQQSWDSLPADLQAVLGEGQTIWETAILSELTKAEITGAAFGKESGVEFVTFDPADQLKFDEIYNRAALADARHLQKLKIDGEPVFRRAQALIAGGPEDCGAAPEVAAP